MNKISIVQYTTFLQKWNNKEFPHQRYGQAFISFCALECGVSILCPELFYSEWMKFSQSLITDYINWES